MVARARNQTGKDQLQGNLTRPGRYSARPTSCQTSGSVSETQETCAQSMAALEKHYTVAEVASLWQLSEELQSRERDVGVSGIQAHLARISQTKNRKRLSLLA